jgi:5-formyltetrahydrofolate cyclo-ligase
MHPDSVAEAKWALRGRLLAARRARPVAERTEATTAWTARLEALPESAGATIVATYLATPEEPDTAVLIDLLLARGSTVLVPILRPDFDLDWAAYDPARVQAGRFGIVEPATDRLGVDAVTRADIVICPGLAADVSGRRLGRGGGSYDRVLSRVRSDALICLPLYEDEVLDEVPAHDHDQRVDVIVTPSRTIRTRRSD